MMNGFVYHEDYDKYDLGIDHPLIGDKPKRTIQDLKQTGLLGQFTLFSPPLADEKDLIRVHGEAYIKRIKKLSETGGMIALDTPAPKGIYSIAARATGGSIYCGEKLFEGYSLMINPLGGFHHASLHHTSGFCFFNDIAVTIEFLRSHHDIQRFLIIDLDVHHGNGTQDIYYGDPTVLNFSIHQDGRTLYPGTGSIDSIGRDAGEGYTINLPLPPQTGSEAYLSACRFLIPAITEQFDPEIIVFQSGVDTHHTDPLADICLSYQTYYHLGKLIKTVVEKSCRRLIVLMGGGYNSQSSIISYQNIVRGLIGETTYVKENDEYIHNNMDIVQDELKIIQNFLKSYWNFSD